MESRLHVTNGDSAARGIEGTGLAERVLAWRDALHEGPVLPGPDAARRRARADFLGVPVEEFERRDGELDAHLGDFVLWFEADLYDQLQLVEILARLAARGVAPERITLISIGEHAGRAHFGGLGELTSEQLRVVAEQAATPLTGAALELATQAWDALRAPQPAGIAALASEASGELRFLGEAFLRLCQEYPARRDGLSLTERRLLAGERGTPVERFLRASAKEPRPFLGDTWAFAILERLAHASVPLLDEAGALTPAGVAVLAGEADHVALNGCDRWVGGVRLRGRDIHWRWDEATETLMP